MDYSANAAAVNPNMSNRDYARDYLARGLCPLPLGENKHPYIEWKPYQNRRPTEFEIRGWDWRHGVCTVTGQASGIITLDADTVDAQAYAEDQGIEDDTPRYKTSRGMQYVYPHPGFYVKSSASDIYPGLDIKGDRSVTVLPPTSGREWIMPLPVDLSELPKMPAWLVRALAELEKRTTVRDRPAAGEPIPENQRNSTLASYAGSLVNLHLSETEIFSTLAAINQERCQPPLPENEVASIARSISRYEPSSQVPKFPNNDLGTSFGNESLKKNLKVQSFAGGGRPAPRRWVVENVAPERFPTTFYGDSGKTKSFVAAHIGMTVAAPDQDNWLGHKCVTAPVLMMDFELDEIEQRKRAYDLAAGMGYAEPPEDFLYVDCSEAAPAEAFGVAYETVQERGAKMVIVDSMGLAMAGDTEKASEVLEFFRMYFNPLRALGINILVVDHQAKRVKGEKYGDKDIFGSTYKKATQRSVFQLNGEWVKNAAKGETHFMGELVHTKANLGPQLNPIKMLTVFREDYISIERATEYADMRQEPALEDQIVATLQAVGPQTPEQLANRLEVKVHNVRNRLGELSKFENGQRVEETGEKDGRQKIWRANSQTKFPA